MLFVRQEYVFVITRDTIRFQHFYVRSKLARSQLCSRAKTNRKLANERNKKKIEELETFEKPAINA